MFVVLYGTRPLTTNTGTGLFVCPECGDTEQSYVRKSVRRFFHIFFLPLFQVGKESDLIECQRCGSSFEETILTQYPAFREERKKRAFVEHMLRTLIYTAVSDGRLNEAEINSILVSYGEHSNEFLTRADIEREANLCKLAKAGLATYPRAFQGKLDDPSKQTLLHAAHAVAIADGPLDSEERQFLELLATEMNAPLDLIK